MGAIPVVNRTEESPVSGSGWVSETIGAAAANAQLAFFQLFGPADNIGASPYGTASSAFLGIHVDGPNQKAYIACSLDPSKRCDLWRDDDMDYHFIGSVTEGATFHSTPINITPPGTTGFQEMDISGSIPAGTKGVIIIGKGTGTSNTQICARPPGSTLGTGTLPGLGTGIDKHVHLPCAVIGGKVELYKDTGQAEYSLICSLSVGHWDSTPESVDLRPISTSVWESKNAAPEEALILGIHKNATSDNDAYGFQHPDSTDNDTSAGGLPIHMTVAGTNSSGNIEVYNTDNTNLFLYRAAWIPYQRPIVSGLTQTYVDDNESDLDWTNKHSPSNIEILRAEIPADDLTSHALTGGLAALAVDGTNSKLYITDIANDKIIKCDFDGSNAEDVLSIGQDSRGIALDVAAGKMYWTEHSSNKVRRADLDGSNAEDLVTGESAPMGITIHAGKVYWVNSGIDAIRRANLDGTTPETVLSLEVGDPRGISIDADSGLMFWLDASTNKIYRARIDGSNLTEIVTSNDIADSWIVTDTVARYIYWTQGTGTQKIYRANYDGSEVTELTGALGIPRGIALHNGVAYIAALNQVYTMSIPVYSLIDTIAATTTYTDTHSLGTDTQVAYRVRGTIPQGDGQEDESGAVFTAPAAPTLNAPTYNADDDIDLDLTNNATFPDDHEFQARVDGGSWSTFATVAHPSVAANHASGVADTQYEFRARTLGLDGKASAWSSAQEQWTSLPAVVNPSSAQGSGYIVDLDWEVNPDWNRADGIRIVADDDLDDVYEGTLDDTLGIGATSYQRVYSDRKESKYKIVVKRSGDGATTDSAVLQQKTNTRTAGTFKERAPDPEDPDIPIEGAAVIIWREDTDEILATAQTDVNGAYDVELDPNWPYKISVFFEGPTGKNGGVASGVQA